MDARLERLHALRGTFGSASTKERAGLLRSLARVRWRKAAALAAWHDELLFLAAFPDAYAVHDAARTALDRIAKQVDNLAPRERKALADSGLAGTDSTHTFMFGAARWLARHGETLSFAFPKKRDAERLDQLLHLILTASEHDRFESGEVGTLEWMREASGRANPARWLLARAPDAGAPDDIAWRTFYDAAEVPLRWSLGDSPLSSSRDHLPMRPHLRRAFRALPRDPVAHVMSPLPGIRRACGAEAVRWHDTALGALIARAREVFPTIYANHREIHLAPLGEGATLCVLGASPGDRSALEANFGYVMFSNGVPIGYGGVTPFGAQANTGANIFESFRRSEAPFLFLQALRAFRTMFDVTRFVVNPYQFGAGNEEAIASGAYWFYDRLGFRPAQCAQATLADRERTAIANDRTHRSSITTLRSLARGDVVLTLPDAEGEGPMSEQLLVDAGRHATRTLAAVSAGGRAEWIDREARALLTRCTGAVRALTRAESAGARHLMPILAALEMQIVRWSPGAREALWELVALKGAPQELPWARAAARHAELWRAMAGLTET